MDRLHENRIYTGTVESYSSEGLGIVRLDGVVVFVPQAVRGETCLLYTSQHGLAGLEVPGLHGGLGVLDGLGQHLVLDGGVLVQVELLHHVLDPLAAEEAHQVVLQGDIEPGLAGVALAAGAAAELVVDPAGFVALCADDEEDAYQRQCPCCTSAESGGPPPRS